jgi:hypothetical protein
MYTSVKPPTTSDQPDEAAKRQPLPEHLNKKVHKNEEKDRRKKQKKIEESSKKEEEEEEKKNKNEKKLNVRLFSKKDYIIYDYLRLT